MSGHRLFFESGFNRCDAVIPPLFFKSGVHRCNACAGFASLVRSLFGPSNSDSEMAEAVLCQLGACKSILSALKGRPGHGKVSAAERCRLQSSLRMVALGSLDLARIIEASQSAGFAAEDEDLLLDTLAQAAAHGAPAPLEKHARSSMQNFEELVHFLPESVWCHIKEGRIQEFLDFLLRLGLRHPSEPTSLVMALVVLHQTEGIPATCAMAPNSKLEFVKSIKSMFKARAGLVCSPVAFAQCLPRMPDDFRKQYPVLHEAAFSSQGPVPSRITEVELAQLKAGSRMRAVRGPLATAGMHNMLVPQGMACLPAGLMQFGQGLLMQMQHIANEVSQLKAGQPAAADSKVPPPLMALSLPPHRFASFPRAPEAAVAASSGAPSSSAPPLAVMDASAIVPPQSVDEATARIKACLDLGKADKAETAEAKEKPKAEAKAKGKGKAKAKEEGHCKAKAKAKAKPKEVAQEVPGMPALKKHAPIYFLTCTIYSDVKKKQWRAIEATNRRRDVKFSWKHGHEAWDKCIRWCIDNSI